MFGYLLTLFWAAVVIKGSGTLPSPVLGDLRMIPFSTIQGTDYYKVQVFYTDGIQKPEWRGICTDSTSYKEEAITVCQQMGYNEIQFIRRNTHDPVWFKKVTCEKDTLHLLRCKYDVATGDDRNSCDNQLVVKCDFNKSPEPFDGQLSLCPADVMLPKDNNIDARYSTSFGMISLYKQGTWRGLDQNVSKAFLGSDEADTICRQIGYTGAVPGSAVAKSTSQYTFNNCYNDEYPFLVHKGAWKTTSDINCHNQSHKCLKECYDYQQQKMCETCDSSGAHEIIIQCTFDVTGKKRDILEAGSQNECKLTSDSGGRRPGSHSKLIAGILIPIIFVVVVIIGSIIIYYCCCRKRCNKGEKQPLTQN